jgi:dTMP kinase
MLLVIEGLDGSGKSTQVKKLKDYITSLGKELKYIHFPRFDAPVVGDVIARFLRGEFGTIDKIDPLLVAYLFAEDRRDASILVKRWLSQGDVVLFDRYVYSNIAFQCAKVANESKAESLRKWIIDTEYNIFSIPKPDINIFLDVPIHFVDRKLKESRGGKDREYLQGKDDIHENNLDFQRRVREVYLSEVRRDTNFIRIDCSGADGEMLPPDDIFKRIKGEIDKVIR